MFSFFSGMIMFTYHEPMFSLAWVSGNFSTLYITVPYALLYAVHHHMIVTSSLCVLIYLLVGTCFITQLRSLHTVIVYALNCIWKIRYERYAVLADKLKLPFNTVFYLYVKSVPVFACVRYVVSLPTFL